MKTDLKNVQRINRRSSLETGKSDAALPSQDVTSSDTLPTSSARVLSEMQNDIHECWILRVAFPASGPFSKGAAIFRWEILLGNKMLRRISRISLSTWFKSNTGELLKDHLVESGDLSHFLNTVEKTKTEPTDQNEKNSETEFYSEKIKIRNSSLLANQSAGEVISRGKKFVWNLSWPNEEASSGDSFSMQPWQLGGVERFLRGISGNTPPEWELLSVLRNASGTFHLSDTEKKQELPLQMGKGILQRIDFPAHTAGWWWASGADDSKKGSWEILSLNSQNLISINKVFIHFNCPEVDLQFLPMKDYLRVRSSPNLTQWSFSADRGDWRIDGEIHSEILDYLGDSFDDAQGDVFFRASSCFSSSRISLYKKGKMVGLYENKGSTFVEILSQDKIKYIHHQI